MAVFCLYASKLFADCCPAEAAVYCVLAVDVGGADAAAAVAPAATPAAAAGLAGAERSQRVRDVDAEGAAPRAAGAEGAVGRMEVGRLLEYWVRLVDVLGAGADGRLGAVMRVGEDGLEEKLLKLLPLLRDEPEAPFATTSVIGAAVMATAMTAATASIIRLVCIRLPSLMGDVVI